MIRGAGVLMHISSIPSKYGIGTLGEDAFKFVDFIKETGLKYWQILPLGQTGYGDSPYQGFTAFANNPYFIDFDELKNMGLLKEEDYKWEHYEDSKDRVNYGLIYTAKYKVLRKAYENYKNIDNFKEEMKSFKEENSSWLEDYTLYMALKIKNNFKDWYNWDEDVKMRKAESLRKSKVELEDEIEYWSFIQYIFYKQWNKLKEYANKNGIKIIGDIPIYVAADSVETWSSPENFKIDDRTLMPKMISGCPPDVFSATGQLWGNVTYDWNYMKRTDYKWWIDRIKHSLSLYDVLRIDHFRGFADYWEVPYGSDTAVNGKWEEGPGMDLIKNIKNAIGDVEIIAEDLGFLDEKAIKFVKETEFPGMKILQFAFDGSNTNPYLPHNYINKCVAYTGTHDNDTVNGWFDKTAGDHEVKNAIEYLGLNEKEGYTWGFIRGIWSSTADICIAQMQDFLSIGNSGRMNLPSSVGGNWGWRMKWEDVTPNIIKKIARINYIYGRN